MVALVDAIVNLHILPNGSFNGGPDIALEGALDVDLNVALEGAP